MSVSNNYIVKSCFFSCMNNSNTCIGHNLSYLRYKFNCSILEFDYKHCLRLLYKSTLTNVDNANLNVLKNLLNVQDQHLTIHELSDDEIEFMIHDIATN